MMVSSSVALHHIFEIGSLTGCLDSVISKLQESSYLHFPPSSGVIAPNILHGY